MNTQADVLKQSTPKTLYQSDHRTNDLSKISEIYREDINISIWERRLDDPLATSSKFVVKENPKFEFSEVLQPNDVKQSLKSSIGSNHEMFSFFDDVSYLAFMFCKLFGQKKLWLRLDGIDRPMCPRFHTDQLKCRLVTTYVGPATQWIPHHLVNRSKLGYGNDGKPDEKSGLFSSNKDIEQLDTGHVALLKGESWKGNDGAGLVHRSPHQEGDYKRLYLTIDFVETYISIYKNSLSY